MVYETRYSDSLTHYGVKGQKWGVRRYQNPDGTLTAEGKKRRVYAHGKVHLDKGTLVQRISSKSAEESTGHAFVSFKKLDNLFYEVNAGEDGMIWTANYDPKHPNDPLYDNKGFKIELKVTNDIIAPSYNESVDAFVRAFCKSAQEVPLSELVKRTVTDKEQVVEFIDDLSNFSVREAQERAYLKYAKSLVRSPENRKAFFDELQSQGYNAVVDHNDGRRKNSTGGVDMPLIVFERSGTLEQVSATPITWRSQEKLMPEFNRLSEKRREKLAAIVNS